MKRLHPSSLHEYSKECEKSEPRVKGLPRLCDTRYGVIQCQLALVRQCLEACLFSDQLVTQFNDASEIIKRVYGDLIADKKRELLQQHRRVYYTSVTRHLLHSGGSNNDNNDDDPKTTATVWLENQLKEWHSKHWGQQMDSLIEQRDDDMALLAKCRRHLDSLRPRYQPSDVPIVPYSLASCIVYGGLLYQAMVPPHFDAFCQHYGQEDLTLVSQLSRTCSGLYVMVALNKPLWLTLFAHTAIFYMMVQLQCSNDIAIIEHIVLHDLQRLVILDWMAQRTAERLQQLSQDHQLRARYPEHINPVLRTLTVPRLASRMYIQKESAVEKDFLALRRDAMIARQSLLSMIDLYFSGLRRRLKDF